VTWSRLEDLRSRDGTRVAAWRMDAQGEARGDVVLFGGLADHMGRYVHVAAALTKAGWRVTGADLRGNGHSDGRRGFVRKWQDYADDVDVAVRSVGAKPVIVAHSTGGLAVLDWLRTNEARAVVLSAPLLRPAVKAPRWKLAAAGLLSRTLPWLSMANEIPAGHVSRDAEIVSRYASDPLVYRTVTPRWFTEMTAASARVMEHAPHARTPALVMWGSGDRIVDVGAVAQLARAWGGPIATREWDGLYHEIFNEPERETVLAHATEWLARV
jgi:alpha-beta hydrolase superfamily lysophospholipase